MGARMQLSSTALATQNSIGITSAGTLTVQGASGIATSQTTFPFVNTATIVQLGATTVNLQVGGTTMQHYGYTVW